MIRRSPRSTRTDTLVLYTTLVRSVGYEGRMDWDTSKPDGAPRKLLDVSTLMATGWKPQISTREGIESTVAWYRSEEHTSELQSLMRISYAVFCLKKKIKH